MFYTVVNVEIRTEFRKISIYVDVYHSTLTLARAHIKYNRESSDKP